MYGQTRLWRHATQCTALVALEKAPAPTIIALTDLICIPLGGNRSLPAKRIQIVFHPVVNHIERFAGCDLETPTLLDIKRFKCQLFSLLDCTATTTTTIMTHAFIYGLLWVLVGRVHRLTGTTSPDVIELSLYEVVDPPTFLWPELNIYALTQVNTFKVLFLTPFILLIY